MPESVWCLNFHPSCKNWDGMVFCNSCKIAVDIYLQSGTGESTRSEYGTTFTAGRREVNQWNDLLQVGKDFPTFQQFMQIAQGSNELTTIVNGADYSTTGGHVDINGRRMISFIGCEECCGYLWQWLQWLTEEEMNSFDPNINVGALSDGQGTFGLFYESFRFILGGGAWGPILIGAAGSRCLAGDPTGIAVGRDVGGRGQTKLSFS